MIAPFPDRGLLVPLYRPVICHTYNSMAMLTSFKEKKVQAGKDQEKAQSEKDSHSKNRGGKKPN